MQKKIVIVDDDLSYSLPLQGRFLYDYFDFVEVEIITEKDYFDEFLTQLHKIDALIISEKFYKEDLNQYEIAHIFVLTEEQNMDLPETNQIHFMYKYTNLKGIYSQIVGICQMSSLNQKKKVETQMIVVTSAVGGVGKTTIALGMAKALGDMHKRVLYIEASDIQSFQYYLDNKEPIIRQDIYTKMASPSRTIYQEIKSEIREQGFSYLPPLRAAPMSFGISYDIFGMIGKSAKESGEYDYVIVDADVRFGEQKAKLLKACDRVLFVTDETRKARYSLKQLLMNIGNVHSNKYVYVCNKYDSHNEEDDTDIAIHIDEYVGILNPAEREILTKLAKNVGIRKVVFLLI